NTELDTKRPWRACRALMHAAWTACASSEEVDVLVLELGVRQRGDVRQLLRTLQPDIAVLTALTPSYGNDIEGIRIQQEEMRVLCQSAGAHCHFLVEDSDRLLSEAVQALSIPFVPLGLARWSENGHGLRLHSDKQDYLVTRELIGESERVAVQAAVLLAERWTSLTSEDIKRFLAGEEA